MNQIKFNDLPLQDKAILLGEYGLYLQSMEYYAYALHLYALHSNFVEVFYNMNTRQIDRISMAKYTDLDKHLSQIIIPRK